jgi:hypothetical protein
MDEINAFLDKAEIMVPNRAAAYVTGEPLFDVLWRTLVGNLGLRPMIAPESGGQEYYAARRDINEARLSGAFPSFDDTRPYFGRLLALTLVYNLCETQKDLGVWRLLMRRLEMRYM